MWCHASLGLATTSKSCRAHGDATLPPHPNNALLGGGNSHISYFHPEIWGSDEPILTILFFRGVETTNQLMIRAKENNPQMRPILDMIIYQTPFPLVHVDSHQKPW